MENKFYRLGHRLIIAALVSLFLCSTLFFFGPLHIYIREHDNLWFSFNSILQPVIIIFLIAFTICTFICTLAPKQILHKICCALVFGVGLALYLQGNFVNTKYGSGVLDGSQIIWSDYTTYGAIDCGIWAACIALPFALIMVFKKRWRAILMTASIAIVVVQALSLTTSIVSNQEMLNKSTCEVQKVGMYDLSKDKNTLVFVLDSFDQAYLDELLENNPEYIDNLGGFVEYTNALAGGSRRIEAFSSTLLGSPFKKDTSFRNFIDDKWEGKNAYSLLKDKGVDTRIFADQTYFGGDADKTIQNVYKSDEEEGANTAIVKTIYKYTFFEYSQHYFKHLFWLDASVFNSYKSKYSYERDDAEFYQNFIANNGFTYTNSYDNSVRIYSMLGASEPFLLTQDGKGSDTSTSREEQIKGCFKIIFDMINNLKENNQYSRANIIIMGSNGDLNKGEHPALLIKRSGFTNNLTQNTTPVSLTDLPTTIASFVSTEYKSIGTGETFFNIKNDTIDQKRTRLFYLNTGANSDTRIEEYKLTGDVNDKEKLELTNIFYTNNGVREKYELGTSKSFLMDATANIYCKEGFRGTTGWRTPLAGPKCIMEIPIKSIPKNAVDVHVYFDVNAVDYYSYFDIYSNGNEILTRKGADSLLTHGINFTVPIEYIKDDGTLSLEFYFSDIDNKELDKSIYDRTITLSFASFKIYTQ